MLALDRGANDNKITETIWKPRAFLSRIESCWVGHNETIIEDEPDKEERLGSGYAEPILSLACSLFSPKVLVVPTLPVASTGTATRTFDPLGALSGASNGSSDHLDEARTLPKDLARRRHNLTSDGPSSK